MKSDRDRIVAVLGSINEAWLRRDYSTLIEHLAENVVLAVSQSDHRLSGRDAYVQSYRDYDSAAATLEFEAGAPKIDVIEDTAVALCSFRVVYELDGAIYREEGTDMLVLKRRDGVWRVVWRSMQTEATA